MEVAVNDIRGSKEGRLELTGTVEKRNGRAVMQYVLVKMLRF
jgi:hypothetical protein